MSPCKCIIHILPNSLKAPFMSRTLNLLRQGAEHKIGLLNIKSIWGHFFFSVSCRDPRDSHWFEPFTIETCLRLLKMSSPDEKLSGHKDVQIPGT